MTKQIPINLQCGLVITITCNLGKQGVCNILPPRTCRHKTAFIVIDETDTNQRSLWDSICTDRTSRWGDCKASDFGRRLLPNDGHNSDNR